MVHEPVQGGLAGVEDREVSVVRTEPEFGRRATPREPLAVRARYDPVQAAMDEEHCRGYLGGVEAPRRDVREVIVYRRCRAGCDGRSDDVQQPGPRPGECGKVARSELRVVVIAERLRVSPLAPRSFAAARSIATPESAMPANQSSPSAPNWASPAMLTTPRTRSGSSAPQARACGPPPEWPMTANRSMPSASATLATYVASDATSRPADDVDPPYPGRSYDTHRIP